MRISAANRDGYLYRVFDHAARAFRHDLVWVDDEAARLGVGYATCGVEVTYRVEQRRRVVIVPVIRWVSVDLPDEEEGIPQTERDRTPELVLVERRGASS